MNILCWFGRHRWKNFGGNTSKVVGLSHLHPQAGLIELCTRCGKVWDDLLYGFGADEPGAKEYRRCALSDIREYSETHRLKPWGDWK